MAPLTLSLLFASVSIFLLPPFRGILAPFIPSILSSFTLADGNVIHCARLCCTGMVVEMGETRQVCGLVGIGSSGDAVGLGQQLD